MTAASFVVPTRSRIDNVRNLLASIRTQTVAAEVLVMDDGGSRELAEMIQREFTFANYLSLGTGRGPAFQRNRGIERASSEFVFPLDDDTRLTSAFTVEQTLAEFGHPRVGAVGIPYINVRCDTQVRQGAPDASGIWVEHAFVGAAHAVRRSAFLAAGGYREHFFYMGEEGDLCLRMLNLGYVVRAGAADPIEHLESPSRNSALADFCGRRNDILFAWHNVPAPDLAFHLAGTTLKGLRTAAGVANPGSAVRGILAGYAAIVEQWHRRRPVARPVYRLQRRLKESGPCRLTAIESLLPALAEPCPSSVN